MKTNLAFYSVILSGLLLFVFFDCKKETPKVTPTLTATAVTNITSNSASAGGVVSADGGDLVTARGVCWSLTNATPSISDSKTSDGTGIGTFSSSISGLTQGTTYNIRAYATNSIGTAYSSASSFKTLALAPTVTTTDVSAITSTSCSSGGNVSNDGGSPVTARGVCWGTNQSPTLADSKTTDASGLGIFVSSITGLTPGIIYYIRAYATNSIGTAYGTQVTATTVAVLPTITTTALSAITSTSANTGGNITNDGGATVTERGVCWSTSSTPTTSNAKSTNGTGIGNFTSSITGLIESTTYYIRSFATNAIGTTYGNELSFKTTIAVKIPTITTFDPYDITDKSINIGGSIVNDGGGVIVERGFCFSKNVNPTTNDLIVKNVSGNTSFTMNVNGLDPVTKYYARAYAINSAGTGYGNSVSFTTGVGKPTLTTFLNFAGSLNLITKNSIEASGNITSDGGAAVTSRGICWNTTGNPTINDSKITAGTGTGIFTGIMTGLLPVTQYYFQAYASNSAGTSYGGQISMPTLSGEPVVNTVSSTITSDNIATISCNISNDGGTSIISKGVCWSTSQNPTISDNKTNNGTGTGNYTSQISSLLPNTNYYVRAYATNSSGTSYGNNIERGTYGLSISDIDGNSYSIIRVGTQVWMSENLKATKYSDGTIIPLVTDNSTWSNLSTSAYCWYNNDMATNKAKYGALYNWYAVNSTKLCPSGWHIPTDDEWTVLENFVIQYNVYGAGTTYRDALPLLENASIGFNATYSGWRYEGNYQRLGSHAIWWSSTLWITDWTTDYAYIRNIGDTSGTADNVSRYYAPKNTGLAVRCVKN